MNFVYSLLSKNSVQSFILKTNLLTTSYKCELNISYILLEWIFLAVSWLRMRGMKWVCVFMYNMVWYGMAMKHLIFFSDDDIFLCLYSTILYRSAFTHLSIIKLRASVKCRTACRVVQNAIQTQSDESYKQRWRQLLCRQVNCDVTHCIFYEHWFDICHVKYIDGIDFVHLILISHLLWIKAGCRSFTAEYNIRTTKVIGKYAELDAYRRRPFYFSAHTWCER